MVLAIRLSEVALRVTAQEGVQKVACQGLGAHLVITGVEVDWLFQAESVDPLQRLALNLDLFWIRKVAERHA